MDKSVLSSTTRHVNKELNGTQESFRGRNLWVRNATVIWETNKLDHQSQFLFGQRLLSNSAFPKLFWSWSSL